MTLVAVGRGGVNSLGLLELVDGPTDGPVGGIGAGHVVGLLTGSEATDRSPRIWTLVRIFVYCLLMSGCPG